MNVTSYHHYGNSTHPHIHKSHHKLHTLPHSHAHMLTPPTCVCVSINTWVCSWEQAIMSSCHLWGHNGTIDEATIQSPSPCRPYKCIVQVNTHTSTPTHTHTLQVNDHFNWCTPSPPVQIQEISAEPGTVLQEYIQTINSCYPEEIVR